MSLSTDIDARLGRPPVALETVVVAPRAREQLGAVLDALPRSANVAVLVDENVYRTAGDADVKRTIIDALASTRTVVPVVLPGEVHADEETVVTAVAACADADVVVTIGSGTLCDIGKVAAGDRPHVVVQSAASVNGFADDQSVLLIKGVKRTAHSGWPHAILIDEDVLVAAPSTLNRSGLGDMISMFTAPADWYLASLFGMDRGFDAEYAVMTRRYGDDLLAAAGGIGSSDPTALTTLAEFLTLSGISMGVAGQTSPSSGMEHTVSHLIDMANGASHIPLAHHGEQVGVATVLVSLVWRRMAARLAAGDLTLSLPSATQAEAAVRDAFARLDSTGAMADECWADYSKKLHHLESTDAIAHLDRAMADWSTHAERLDDMLVAPERIVRALREAGAPTRFRDLSKPVDAETATWALTKCHLMRNRFTIADLAFLTGNWGPDDVAAIVAEADALDAGL